MKKHFLLTLPLWVFACGMLSAQIAFTNKNDLIGGNTHYSGVAIAVLDMNGDGLDDIVRMNYGILLSISYQTGANQPFVYQMIGDLPNNGSQWGMCAADVDNNGYGDVLAGGYYDGVKIAMANADGSNFAVVNLTNPETFVQGVNFADVNNDGWLDAFVCHDDGIARIFVNDGAGNLSYDPNIIDLSTFPVSDNSGNYGSIWSDVDNDNDLDLYIAKCRQGVNDSSDPRRINQLFINNGDGTYTQDITNVYGLRIGAQSWTADFGDIDNDGDFDCFITNHDVSSMLLENDGAGHFTDISAAAGILNNMPGAAMQGVMRDFDNDGFLDIIVAGSSQYLFRNNGDKTFSAIGNPFSNNAMESFAIGDLNHDGFLDVYGGYAYIYTDPSTIPDVLWMNNGNDNHYFGVNLYGTQSNRSAVGSKVTLYSALGKQVREVRAGESYGIMNSMQLNFGLGQVTHIDSLEIRWPSGKVDKLYDLDADQYISVEESGCISMTINVEADGPLVFCSGDSLVLTAPSGSIYQWNNNLGDQSITVTASGVYQVTVTDDQGCSSVSGIVSVTVDPVEIPSISALSDTIICAGGATTLQASPASEYIWNTGETTPSITVTQSGDYFVSAKGLCSFFNSSSIHVEVLAAPEPQTLGDTIAIGTQATLSASGSQLVWFGSETGSDTLATGETLQTPVLDASTTYWVSGTTTYDTDNVFTGMSAHQGSATSGTQFNGRLIFDAYKPFRLHKVRVYTAKFGVRKIDLKDAEGNLLQTTSVDIQQDITDITLDFDIPVGSDMYLTTDQEVNLDVVGTISPQLRRSDQNVMYPYEIPDYVSIKNSNAGLDRYYYFFNWEIDFYGHDCESPRVPVLAFVDPNIVATEEVGKTTRVDLFPNPSNGVMTVRIPECKGGPMYFSLFNATGMRLENIRTEAPAGFFSRDLNFSQMPKGAYWLEIGTADGIVRKKITLL